MKKQKRRENKPAEVVAAAPRFPWWYWAAGLAALFIVLEAYGPALRGPFVLDDQYLFYADPGTTSYTLSQALHTLRPLLMASFWVNYTMSGPVTYSYHAVNVLLHFGVSILAMCIAARLLQWAGVEGRMRQVLAAFAGALFLLHPLQTESVAYVASRSEVLSVLFYYAAFAVFLYDNSQKMSLRRALAIVALFGAAIATKEHTLTLPLLFLLTDFFWGRGGWRKNIVLYGLLAVLSAVGGLVVAKMLATASSAGFAMKDLSPVMYFFTECRVIWIYARLFFLPYGQNVDPDLAISQGPMDHGAIFGLAALIALAAAAWIFRKRWPLASYGVFVFLLLLAPTSSLAPIRDVMAERRMYLPFIGLTLVVLEVLRRLELKQAIAAGVAILSIAAVLTYQRSNVWSSAEALWTDTAAKSPRKMRPLFHLAFAQYQEGNCGRAAATFEAASRLDAPDYRLLVDWANALSCAGQKDRAADEYSAAIRLNPGLAEAYVGLSAVYGEQRKLDEALRALDTAHAIDPGIAQIYVNRGGVFELQGNRAGAAEQYRHALKIDPTNRTAREALQRLGR